jgi:hypothetical protein
LFTFGADPEFEIHNLNPQSSQYSRGYYRQHPGFVNARTFLPKRYRPQGMGTDGSILELRYNKGYTKVEDIMADTAYWITHMTRLKNYNAIELDKFSVRAGSGKHMSLGGHLHTIWDNRVMDISSDFTARESFIDSALLPIALPTFLAEDKVDRATRRRNFGSFGGVFATREDRHHIEWRMPFSFYHSKLLTRGMFGMWCWWSELMDALYNKQISHTRFMRVVHKMGHRDLIYNINNRYNSYYSDRTASMAAVTKKNEKLRKEGLEIFKDSHKEFRNVNIRLYDKWAPYFLPMFNNILDGKKFNENKDIVKLWASDNIKITKDRPKAEQKCIKCGQKLFVGHSKINLEGKMEHISDCYPNNYYYYR